IGPATSRSVYPLNHVIAYVHWIGIGRHHLDAKRILVTNRFERLIPPARAFKQCCAHRLGCSAIYVVHDRLNGFANSSAGIFFLQTMTSNETLGDRLLDGRGEVHICDAIETRSRIKDPWFISGRRQFDERDMLAHCECLRRGCNLSYEWSRLLSSECQCC